MTYAIDITVVPMRVVDRATKKPVATSRVIRIYFPVIRMPNGGGSELQPRGECFGDVEVSGVRHDEVPVISK